MVLEVVETDLTVSDEESDACVSVITSEDDGYCSKSVALQEDDALDNLTFGNVAVTNSTDIHFGNKTYYQGPVTIKKILYANNTRIEEDFINGSVTEGKDNPSFVSDKDVVANNVNNECTQLEKTPKDDTKSNRRFCLLIIAPTILILCVIIALTIIFINNYENKSSVSYPKDSDELDTRTPISSPLDDGGLNIVTRDAWVAQPRGATPKLKLPVPYIILSQTKTENCLDKGSCILIVRLMQTLNIESNNGKDIRYNFLIGGDGRIYEGRGWLYEGAHTYGYNSRSIGISFIGTYNNIAPSELQIKLAKDLIAVGIKRGVIMQNYKLLAASQLDDKSDLGEAAFNAIKTWPHWFNYIKHD